MGVLVMPPKKEPKKSRGKTAADYVTEIKSKYIELLADPSNDTIQHQLNYLVGKLEEKTEKTIIRANNEGYPWEEHDLKMPVRKMPTKEESGEYQTADYIFYYKGPGFAGYGSLLVERKGGDKKKGGPQDLYGTLMVAKNCDRFYREIDRFHDDKRFTQMVIIAECTFSEFLLYVPPFIGKSRNTEHVGASVEARRGKIASLYARGITVIFAGTRYNAIEVYKALIRQWIIKNYVSILGLDKLVYDDHAELTKKIAYHEAELLALKSSLARIEKTPEEAEA